jgi:hypothetical protein
MTTVTDADREAAALYLVSAGADREWADFIVAGQSDHELMLQAFARHREATESRARLEGAEIAREAAARVCKDQRAAFADPAYAGSSRMAAFEERFACGECLNGIESLDLAAILAEQGRGEAIDAEPPVG